MAHFARVNSDNIVTYVTPVDNEIITRNGIEIPELGIAHLYNTIPDSVGDRWIQTSYNRNFRKNYAGIGMIYNEELDAFIHQKPYPSWTLDSNGDWNAPVLHPQDENIYEWDEENLNWKLVQ